VELDTNRSMPPAGLSARIFTIASPFLPIMIPVAWYLQRKAFAQASANSAYAWPDRWWNRPLVFTIVAWVALPAVVVVLYGLSWVIGQKFE
jgi:hypothetical protein